MSNEKDIRLRQHSQLPKCTKPSRDLRPNDNGTSSPFNQPTLYLIVERIGCIPSLNSLSVTRKWKEDQIRSLRIEEKMDLIQLGSSIRECMRIGILLRTGCFLFLFIHLEKPPKPAFLIRCDSIFQLKLSYRPTEKVGVRLPFPFLARAKGSFSFYQKVHYLLVAVIECISHFMLAPSRASWSVVDETFDFYRTYSIARWARCWGLALQEIKQPFFPYLVCFPAYRATSQLAK